LSADLYPELKFLIPLMRRSKPSVDGDLVLIQTTTSLQFLKLVDLPPNNRHIRDKIRQQLQVLRDAKLLLHVGRDCWRLP
jgi:hypothetical protein